MRLTLLILLTVMLSGCPASCPIIEPIRVPVRVTESANPELTKPVPVYERTDGTCGQYREQAARNTAAAQVCNTQLDAIAGRPHDTP
jgi:hypothetical protein